jgi:hypothetical protein
LADASVAYTLTEHAARKLLDEGHRPEPIGEQIEPPKTILCVSGKRIDAIVDKHQIPVRLGTEFFAARYVALVRFEGDASFGG